MDVNYKLNIPNHFMLNYSRYKNYSKFVSSVSFFTKYVIHKYFHKNILNLGIVINTRSKDNIEFGNFEQCLIVKIDKGYSMDKIAKLITDGIHKYKNKNLNTNIKTAIDYKLCDFIFNSHKTFTEIKENKYNFYYKNSPLSKSYMIKKFIKGNILFILNYTGKYYYINNIHNI